MLVGKLLTSHASLAGEQWSWLRLYFEIYNDTKTIKLYKSTSFLIQYNQKSVTESTNCLQKAWPSIRPKGFVCFFTTTAIALWWPSGRMQV